MVPEKQDDGRRLAAMVNLLRAHGIEVSRATEAFKVKEGDFAAGSYVVRMDQPYRGYALDLLLPQSYPADKAPYPAYDDVAWSLPVAMGMETTVVEDEAVRRVPVAAVTEPVAYRGAVSGNGPVYVVKDTGQESLLAARVRLARFKIDAAEKPFSSGGDDYPAGSWVIADQPGLRRGLEDSAADLDLAVSSLSSAPSVPRHAVDLPRLAVLQSWTDTQAPGWVRMIFDEEKVPYTPSSSPDITGGWTWKGLDNLADFVREGGTLVTLGGASTVPLDGGIAGGTRS